MIIPGAYVWVIVATVVLVVAGVVYFVNAVNRSGRP